MKTETTNILKLNYYAKTSNKKKHREYLLLKFLFVLNFKKNVLERRNTSFGFRKNLKKKVGNRNELTNDSQHFIYETAFSNIGGNKRL